MQVLDELENLSARILSTATGACLALVRKHNNCRKSLLDVFTAVAQQEVKSVCSACRNLADTKPEVRKHPLYKPPVSRSKPSAGGHTSANEVPTVPSVESSRAVTVIYDEHSYAKQPTQLDCLEDLSDICEVGPCMCVAEEVVLGSEGSAVLSDRNEAFRESLLWLQRYEEVCEKLEGVYVNEGNERVAKCESFVDNAVWAAENTVVHEEIIDAIVNSIDSILTENSLDSRLETQAGRVQVVEAVGRRKNMLLCDEVQEAISKAPELRSMESLLSLKGGRFSSRTYNPVVETFVRTISTVNSTTSAELQRLARQNEAIEAICAARNLRYCSEFNLQCGYLQCCNKHSVCYSIAGSRTVIDLMGHLGAGVSYSLLKSWLSDIGGEELVVPSGFVSAAFDNEQRIMHSYLARGRNRSACDVLTNVVYVQHSAANVQNDEQLHHRYWSYPSENTILKVIQDKPLESCISNDHLLDYLQERIIALQSAGRTDRVDKLLGEQEESQLYITCPGCKTKVDKKKRNCPNTDCPVKSIRAAVAEAAGKSHLSTEVEAPPRRATVRSGTSFHYILEPSSDGAIALK